MDQHPVPQNISSYEFRLVGDMTLKQFLQLAAGALIGLIIFKLPIISIVRYPLVFLSALTGVMMAFVPIQGRSFTQWIMAFIKAIYAPTEYHWPPPPFLPPPAPGTSRAPPPLPPPPPPPRLSPPGQADRFYQSVRSAPPSYSHPPRFSRHLTRSRHPPAHSQQ